jgi:hypothetical protein
MFVAWTLALTDAFARHTSRWLLDVISVHQSIVAISRAPAAESSLPITERLHALLTATPESALRHSSKHQTILASSGILTASFIVVQPLQ